MERAYFRVHFLLQTTERNGRETRKKSWRTESVIGERFSYGSLFLTRTLSFRYSKYFLNNEDIGKLQRRKNI